MNTIIKVYNLIILDESGSMESLKKVTINGFNELLQSIRNSAIENPEIQQWVNFYSFNGLAIKEQLPLKMAKELAELSENSYQPQDMTPLYDAIGIAVNNLQRILKQETNYSVLVTILTDGQENKSKEYTHTSIKALISALKANGWVFTYIGANHDVAETAISLSIINHLKFDACVEDTQVMFEKNSKSRKIFMDKIKSNKTDKIQGGFFDDPDNPK